MAIRAMMALTLFFPMFPFDPPENIRKPGFLMFSGESKGNIGKKGLMGNDRKAVVDYKLFICLFRNS